MGIEYRPYGDTELDWDTGKERKVLAKGRKWFPGHIIFVGVEWVRRQDAHSNKSQLITTTNVKGKQQIPMQTRRINMPGETEEPTNH